ncbi:MAG: substrate-binding domain-containing protein [Clostridia bacterium]
MKNKRILALVICVIFTLFVFSGCVKLDNKKEIRAMFIPKAKDTSFWKITIAGYNTALSEYNVKGLVSAPSNEEDYDTQIKLIEKAIEEKYDIIIVSSIHFEKPKEALERAIAQGIGVVIIDSDVNSNKIKVRISTDNYQAGFKMGEQMAKDLGYRGDVGILMFDENTKNGLDRMNGLIDALKQYSAMRVVDKVYTKSNEIDAKAGGLQLLKNNPQLDAVATFNEFTTVGLGMAVEEYGKPIYAIGFDNNSTVVDYLERGIFDALIVQNQFSMGYLAVEYGVNLINGKIKKAVNLDTGINVITTENMYNPDIQNILFPFIQVE